jgi:hypothetical protein
MAQKIDLDQCDQIAIRLASKGPISLIPKKL